MSCGSYFVKVSVGFNQVNVSYIYEKFDGLKPVD